jgi:ribosomal protein S18 acetylase RimI-like enzyme
MKEASPQDIPRLIELMTDSYAEAGYALNRQHATDGFTELLANDRLGAVWIIQADTEDVGYVVLTKCFSMEYGGTVGFVDDFFIRAACRRAGLGSKALAELREHGAEAGLRALFVEVGPDNAAAQLVYRRVGFTDTARQLLVLPLARPVHLDSANAPEK